MESIEEGIKPKIDEDVLLRMAQNFYYIDSRVPPPSPFIYYYYYFIIIN